jgi:hypothetical protein
MRVCENCNRSLVETKFRSYNNQATGEKLDMICLSCRSYRGSKPSLEAVLAGEEQLQALISQARQKFDPVIERIMFEELLYKLMITGGYLKEWKRPVWLSDNLFKEEMRVK